MIDTKNKILIAGLILIFGSCIEPVSDDLWSVMIEKECGTSGYARDVHVENDIAYVAAGEGGAEIWDLSSGSVPTLLNAISLDDIGARKEISKIWEPKNKFKIWLEIETLLVRKWLKWVLSQPMYQKHCVNVAALIFSALMKSSAKLNMMLLPFLHRLPNM